MTVYLFATLDTKGEEAAFLKQTMESLGLDVHLVDTGCVGDVHVSADTPREEVYAAAGTTWQSIRAQGDRGAAVAAAAAGAQAIARRAFDNGQLKGVLGIGGSAGTTIGTSAMRSLPIGVPKVMVSTLASGQVRPYVGDKDIMMVNSVVDIAGLNRISRRVLASAAAAMAGMVTHQVSDHADDRRLIAATMFGVTTPCVQRAREVLQDAGFEVLVFHATGNGGQAMESLIRDGLIAGVLDITTTELADELVGGVLSAGPDRLKAAAEIGVPQLVSVGATDMVNFGPRETVPERFAKRQFHVHNPTVTLMRTTVGENQQLGKLIAERVAASRGPAVIMLPKQGVSALDAPGQPFENRLARESLFAAIRSNCGVIPVRELDAHINDEEFAVAAAHQLLELIRQPADSPQDST